MNKQALTNQLNVLLAMTAHSLARHVCEAQPYFSAEIHPLWRRIQEVVRIDCDHEQRLSHLITSTGLPFEPGTYRADVANYHFMNLSVVQARLVEDEHRQKLAFERAITYAQGDTRFVSELQDMLHQTQHCLELIKGEDSPVSQAV